MNPEPTPTPTPEPRPTLPPRAGLAGRAEGRQRAEFCYMMAPGQDYYHRLLDGEVYLFNGDERVCLACASTGACSLTRPAAWAGSSPSSTSTPRTALSSS